MIREERAKELPRAGMENNAARKPERHAMAILSEERPGEAVSESWRRLHKSPYGGHLINIVCNIEKLLEILSSILCTILLLILLNITLNIMKNTVNNIEQLFTKFWEIP